MQDNIIKEKKAKKRSKMNIVMWVVFGILMLYVISMVGMLLWGAITSLRCTYDYSKGVFGLPKIYMYQLNKQGEMVLVLTKDATGKLVTDMSARDALFGLNYRKAIQVFNNIQVQDRSFTSIWSDKLIARPGGSINLAEILWNTIFYAGICTLVYTFVCMTVAYLCSKYKFKFSNVLYITNLIVMSIPIVGSQPAMLDFMMDMGIYDSYWGMLLQKVSFTGMYFFVFKAFFDSIPNSYIEAAEIDGASQWSCYIQIMVPLAIKMFGTIFLLQFITLWNDYQTPFLYFPTHPTLSKGIYDVTMGVTASKFSDPEKFAFCFLIALPIIILFAFFNKKIMGDVSLGGLKE